MEKTTVLDNGLTVVTEHVAHRRAVCVNFLVKVGSAHEPPEKAGIAHYVEHMLFKGTRRRTALEIAAELESVGGDLNAYTEKEYTCYYAVCLDEHIGRAVDVLTDILTDSVLGPQELERERNVLLSEIAEQEDTPQVKIHDLFANTIWGGHPLGRSVSGTLETVKRLRREDIVDFLRWAYTPDRIIVSAAGNVDHQQVTAAVAEAFNNHQASASSKNGQIPLPLPQASFTSRSMRKDCEQAYFCLGTQTYPRSHPDTPVINLLSCCLGGGASSRLFHEIREKRGLAYAIGCYSASSRTTGVFVVHGITQPGLLEEVLGLCARELGKIRKGDISADELAKAKQQIIGTIHISMDSVSARAQRLAKSQYIYDRIVPIEEVIGKIERVTQEHLVRVANELFYEQHMALATLGPFNGDEPEMPLIEYR